MTEETIIQQTADWINTVVAGCNFCPFAAKAIAKKSIRYLVLENANAKKTLETFIKELYYLDEEENTETSFLILPDSFGDFNAYLDLVDMAEQLLEKEDYEGIYQVASFHPQYCFAGASEDDPANYTNRSPYPMLHILREDSITKALKFFPNPETIPDRNIEFARQKGLQYMQMLRATCMD